MLSAIIALTLAGAPVYHSWTHTCTAGTCTTSAPTSSTPPDMSANGSPGRKLFGVSGLTISVCATSGQTLSGAGTIDMYWWSENPKNWNTIGQWGFSKGLQLSLADYSGKACAVFNSWELPGRGLGVLYPIPNGVTVSGGTSLYILLDGYYTGL